LRLEGQNVRTETIGLATVVCADCLEVLSSLSGVDAFITDPPYSSGGMVRGDRMAKTSAKYLGAEQQRNELHAEFSGDNRDQRGFEFWATMWASACRNAAKPGALFGAFMDWRQLPVTTDYVQAGGWVWRGVAVWDKTEAARLQKGRYRNQSEFLVWATNGPREFDGA
jgi:site-specific DNA-methyltransferase (adenine-specific)